MLIIQSAQGLAFVQSHSFGLEYLSASSLDISIDSVHWQWLKFLIWTSEEIVSQENLDIPQTQLLYIFRG